MCKQLNGLVLLADLLKSKSLDLLEVAVSCIHTLLCNADLQASGVSILSIYVIWINMASGVSISSTISYHIKSYHILYKYMANIGGSYPQCRLCGGGLVDLLRVSLCASCIQKN
jgi:hypothetical protein